MLWNDKPYHTLDYELKRTYGEKIYKIALDANMTCPNRDGSCGVRGCIFCSAGGSGDFAAKKSTDEDAVATQLEKGIQYFHGKQIGKHFIAYFQAYTNTYAPIPKLESLYREALEEPSVVGISIATRPDCLGSDVLSLLDRLNREYADKFIWIELGLQTIHEHTALLIRRGYPLSIFEQAVKRLQDISIPTITHVIIGLPGETKSMMLETCCYLGRLGIDGIKLQLLHILKNTDLVELYKKKTFEILDMMGYIDIIISCLEILPSDMVIHRVTGDGPKELLLAPLWSLDKRRVLNTLHQEMKRRSTWQSKYCQI
ncbi:MAG: TIGR01212 family radical SAM protein [Lachnospiraceae bacterium]|nr:TIGR01212 family radical SAM protein [Lachnospiraceae bacterium]MDE7184830.1 TIGR01212 family radical SAM protein [Lachnospiraceae bacterium]